MQDSTSGTVLAVLDSELDLATRLKRERLSVASPVPLGPRVVAGQGAFADNLTFVRVLNPNGVPETQFLAYPFEVKGGVSVAAGRQSSGADFIVTAPISDTGTRNLRVFNSAGGFLFELLIPRGLSAPYQIAVGDFLQDHMGDEVAVTSSQQRLGQSSAVILYSAEGQYLNAIKFTAPGDGMAQLASYRLFDTVGLELFYPEANCLLQFDPQGGAHRFLQLDNAPALTGLYRSAFGEQGYWGALPGAELSQVANFSGAESTGTMNVGRHENEFWITGSAFGFDGEDSGEFIKFARYGHVRTDGSSPAYKNASLFLETEIAGWERAIAPARSGLGQLRLPLDEQQRVLWEPCFTHRQFNDRFDVWESEIDVATELPKYLSLSRLNQVSYYGEFGAENSFVGSTYAFDLPALDRLYLLPLRGFLFSLSEAFRAHPERVISVEPNHEHEIAIKEDQSVGDYNPAMIRGFRTYLKNLYGDDLADVLQVRKGPDLGAFDAPRNTDRGNWDRYDTENPFFNDWVRYNRYVINRRLADTFTQALLAGFPSEIIKSHQIPDAYAVGTLDLFSKRMARITPIDYAMTAGVGFGFTRYMVWFRKSENAFKAASTSGFDSMVLGEYQALTKDQGLANQQLIHLWENGGNAIHAMNWPASHDRGFNETMSQAIGHLLKTHDKPRTVVTGGVSQIKAVERGDQRFNLAAIGTGANKRGLLKSLQEDGSWEGSVYTVPFRTMITVESFETAINQSGAGRKTLTVSPISNIEAGEQFVLEFNASDSRESELTFSVRHVSGGVLPGTLQVLKVSRESKSYRFVLRTQMPADGLILSVEMPASAQLKSVHAQRETEQVARPHIGQHTGVPHQGGITFDLIPDA